MDIKGILLWFVFLSSSVVKNLKGLSSQPGSTLYSVRKQNKTKTTITTLDPGWTEEFDALGPQAARVCRLSVSELEIRWQSETWRSCLEFFFSVSSLKHRAG